jgi:CheY-like chemotaxis protein
LLCGSTYFLLKINYRHTIPRATTKLAVFTLPLISHKLTSEAAKMQKQILIADDNTIVRDMVRAALTAILDINDYQEAANGREAIECAEQTRPDLIILDINMPEMDGITTAHRLKQSMPEIPIILFTMYELGQDSAKKFGVDAVVLKSEGLSTLTSEVQSLLLSH